jgi:hypothetical protein
MAKQESKKYFSDTEIFTMVTKGLNAHKICEKAQINLSTLRRRLYEMSVKRNELITVDGLFQETDIFEVKKLGLIVPRKVLEHKGFVVGQKFKIDFNGDKKITLTITT